MQVGKYNIKPILLYLPDDDFWLKEWKEAQAYLASQGIDDVHEIAGIHYNWGICGNKIYLVDGKPEEKFYIGDKKVCGNLSQYLCFSVMNAMDYTHFMFMEGDVKFVDGWREKLEIEMENVPKDFDFLFVGSCCTLDKDPIHVKGNVYEFPYRGEAKRLHYPQCSQTMIIAKKCIPFLIASNRDVSMPSDVSLVINSFPKLKVCAILPRLSDQGDKTFLPE